MKSFFLRAYQNPDTTLLALAAACIALAATLSDGQPFTVAKVLKCIACVLVALVGAAAKDARDAITPGAGALPDAPPAADLPPKTQALPRWSLTTPLFLLLAALVGCKPLTAAEATVLHLEVGPDCSQLGVDVGTVRLGIVGDVLDAVVGLLCAPIANDIISAESPAPAPAVADAGATPAVPSAGAPVAATSSSVAALFHVTPGCVPVPVPGDPLHEVACPELHAAILTSCKRLLTNAAKAGKAVRK